MANQPDQGLALLYTLKFFMEKTDDVNSCTVQDIIEYLAYHEIDRERKAILRFIGALREFGLDIVSPKKGYYRLATRPLELQEMIMLVDAVQSSPFLTDELTEHLIERIQGLASIDQRKMLKRRIDVPSRIKMTNEGVFTNLDLIQQAMRLHRKIEFHYTKYDGKGKKVLTREKPYVTTPVRLVYADEFYYLIGFHDYFSKIEGGNPFPPFRVDRMVDIKMSDEPASQDPLIAGFELDDHVSPQFGVYAADKVPIELEIQLEAMNPIVDKFGKDVLVYPAGEGRAKICMKAPLSPQFYGWLMQLNATKVDNVHYTHAKITYPPEAVQEYERLLSFIRDQYDE
ncbi:MAG: WYL domain-containing protein [Coriobacteriales bacterium]|nr:WYL domain-containing protein [Coriobacteriales bacterium]